MTAGIWYVCNTDKCCVDPGFLLNRIESIMLPIVQLSLYNRNRTNVQVHTCLLIIISQFPAIYLPIKTNCGDIRICGRPKCAAANLK